MYLKNERGAVIIMVAVAMVAIFGFTALAVDAGYLYLRKSQLQSKVDAVALAAGQELPSQAEAITYVKIYSDENSLSIDEGTEVDITGGKKFEISYADQYPGYMELIFEEDNYKLTVKATIETGLFLARVLGRTEAQVGAAATVGRFNIGGYGEGVLPIGVAEKEFDIDIEYNLTFGPKGDSECDNEWNSGNFAYLDLGHKNTPEFRDWLTSGYDGDDTFYVNEEYPTNTGTISDKQLIDILEERVSEGDVEVIVPIIDSLEVAGKKDVTIVGFAKFILTAVEEDDCGNVVLKGKFIEDLGIGTAVTSGPPVEYAIQTLKLIN